MKANTNSLKIIGLLALTVISISVAAGCQAKPSEDNKTTDTSSDRTVEVTDSEGNFPSTTVDDGKNFIFEYKVTSAKFADKITDNALLKDLVPTNKFLVVEFSAINKSKAEEYGNKPAFSINYNGKPFTPDLAASLAEEENSGVKSYVNESVKSARKGKYVKVFNLDNYDESVNNFKFMVDLESGKAKGEIEVSAA